MREIDQSTGFTYLEDREIFEKVLLESILNAKKSILISTANLRNIRIPKSRKSRKTISCVEFFWRKVQDGVEVRILHSARPTPSWLPDEEKSDERGKPTFVRRRCPRVHFKAVIVDGCECFVGSANLTGAGLGAKSEYKRNFETGFWTTGKSFISLMQERFEKIWQGGFCDKCKIKPDHCDLPLSELPR